MNNPNLHIPAHATELALPEGKRIYFLSDVHLGAPVFTDHREREQRLVQWLESIRPDCGTLFLLGDIFDFWFEYKRAVPKGCVRFLAKLCEFTDNGIPVHFFTGNHDIWVSGYLPAECGVILHTHNEAFRIAGKRFLIGHGDALNPHDRGYMFLYHIFHNRFLQRCFRWLHPDLGILIAEKWSSHSRLSNGTLEADPFRGAGQEEIIRFCHKVLQSTPFDFFLFGHRHLPLDHPLASTPAPQAPPVAATASTPAVPRYINTGDWVTHYTYATFDGTDVRLHRLP